ncbi:prolyl oligopeptidase family serine peptidase [Paenibacillus dokdonensis]|uniref:Prolyl oligopeptidase family serine peptidase n=1 Tax=Paenibacillus dokdonensis TaxID=2567944 RepID=A0ABU6GP60_9BACL|nr:prolyl oligopeptidase family serine peptidase [Paenibacillus dokdonensis]MEC0241520.1 prolyl oligopeptidase family serine peptidase [Paenibacillus dokdonensis]
MMIHMTYLSGEYKVKGYLSLPYGYKLDLDELNAQIHQIYGPAEMPMTVIANNIKEEQQDINERKWPVLIYCRGGIGRVGQVKTEWLERFSRSGFIVFAPVYRGTEGGEGRDEFGGGDMEDVPAACSLLSSLPFIDTQRMSAMGFSRGSVNAAYAASETDYIRQLVLWGGVSDLAKTYEERIDLRRMLKRVVGNPAKVPEAYQARSPIHMAERINCPVLIVHGSDDVQVHSGHGLQMYNRLKEVGADVDMHWYENYGHHMPREMHMRAIERMFNWIREH